jgi:type 1 fimbria pilin
VPGYPDAGTITGNGGINGTTNALQIVKIGAVSAGTVASGVIGTLRLGSNNLDVVRMSLSRAMILTEVSCQTPSVNVALGKHRTSEFGAVGSTTGQTAFNIQLNSCPSGLGGISYRLDPVNTAFNAEQGILALDTGGATGVGIQITNASNGAIALGEVHSFRTAPPSGNYSIPLRAAYYKTANTVTGGVANASMQFTITYQ